MRIIQATREIINIIKRERVREIINIIKRERAIKVEPKTIISDLMNVNNWSKTPKGWGFNCSDYSDETIDLIVQFFKQHHISPFTSSFINQINRGRFLLFSQKDFLCIKYGQFFIKNTHLLKRDNLYNTLSDEDWQQFESVLHVSFGKVSSVLPQFVSKKLFIKKFKENMPKSIIANYILKDFISWIRIMNKKNTPIQLTIHITPPTPENQQLGGFAKNVNGQPFIWLNFDFKHSFYDISAAFLHELKHVVQRYDGVSYFMAFQEPTDMYRTVRNLAIEAEARILTTLIEHPNKFHYIIVPHSNEIFKAVANGTENICYLDNLSPRQKLVATLKHIQIQSYRKTIDTLMDCFLSKSRVDMYNALKKHDISIHPEMFNSLAWHIEDWKKFYFPNTLDNYILDSKRRQTSPDETKGLEEYWYKMTKLKLNLTPSVIFSEEIAHNLGVYDLIYGKDTNKPKARKTYRIKYAGLDDKSANVRQLFDEGNYKEIFDIYDNLRQKNSFLPPKYDLHTEEITAATLMSAIMEMHNQSPISSVLSRLNYETTNNHFDTLNWNKCLIGKYARVNKINKSNERGS